MNASAEECFKVTLHMLHFFESEEYTTRIYNIAHNILYMSTKIKEIWFKIMFE